MGLDNGFILTNKKTKTELELGYFRNFYELDRWVRENGKVNKNFCYEFILDKEILKKLLEEITPIAKKRNSLVDSAKFFHCNIKKPVGHLFSNTTNDLRVIEIKGEMYYGLPGLIFDKNLRPLMYCYVDSIINISKEILIKDIVCAIDPTVLNKDTIMSKFIMKEFIPEFLKISKSIIRAYIKADFVGDDVNIKVEIGDLSKFFYKPQEPKTENINLDITNLLKTCPI